MQTGTIIVKKQTDPAGGTGFAFTHDVDGGGSFDLDDGSREVFYDVAPDTYTVTEGDPTPAGFELTDLVCVEDGTNNSTTDLNNRQAIINLDVGETVICTFSNSRLCSIQVCKDVVPDDTSQWDLSLTGPTPETKDDLGDNECHTFSDLLPGFYTLSETIQAGYFTTVDCGAKGSDNDDDISFMLDPDEHVTCTFTNTHHAALVIEKQTDADQCSSIFTFDLPNLAPGSYPVTEDDPSPAFDLAAITCDDGGSATPSTWDVGTRTATFQLDPAETVKCTFTNAQGGTIIVQKQTHPAGGTGFNFTLDHDQTETFTNLQAGAYTLTEDDPAGNPGGFDLTSLVCLEDDTPNSTTNLTNRQAAIQLDPAETVTCTFTNAQQVTLSLITTGSGDGTIIVEPSGSGGVMANLAGGGYGEDSGRVYGWGAVLTLRAVPGVKSYFVGWGGDCSGTAPTTQLTMDGDKTCTATFGYPIGGIVVPVDRLGLVAPWMGLVALAGFAVLGVALVRRRGD